ncbi:hypothetical protein, partial [Klebsiella pneumoniae]|uniref:hypothetical protein n=1 Tax=Klebsiella pneumoniae TaxID=573 RepID=UPI0025A087CF
GQLLGDAALWGAVDTELATLVTELLADGPVQEEVSGLVAAQVSAALGGGDLGAVVGAQVGDAVVALMQNDAVSAALSGLVATVSNDFFGS